MWECNTPETCPELSACSPQTSVCTVKWSPAIVVAAAAAETDLRTQEGTRTFETYHIAFNFQGAQFSCFSRIWGGAQNLCTTEKISKLLQAATRSSRWAFPSPTGLLSMEGAGAEGSEGPYQKL